MPSSGHRVLTSQLWAAVWSNDSFRRRQARLQLVEDGREVVDGDMAAGLPPHASSRCHVMCREDRPGHGRWGKLRTARHSVFVYYRVQPTTTTTTCLKHRPSSMYRPVQRNSSYDHRYCVNSCLFTHDFFLLVNACVRPAKPEAYPIRPLTHLRLVLSHLRHLKFLNESTLSSLNQITTS